jgi:uncharacterized protein DUF4398
MHIFSPLAGSVGRIGKATAFLALTLALAGCATVPPPDGSMNFAQTQLQMARDAGAADYAPVDLGFAQDKFQQAQAAMAARKYADAANLAEESQADAELARAKARLGAARAQIQSKVQENTRLRAQGEQAAANDAPPAPAATAAPPSTEDMPAPPSSELSAPASGAGFETVPDSSQQPASSSSAQEVQP